jgi:vacuolar-type H+-ATPase subunit I/STV1
MDLTGRVKLMIFGLAGCEIALIGAAVTISLNERAPTYGIQVVAVFFIFLHLAS